MNVVDSWRDRKCVEEDATENRKRHLHGEPRGEKERVQVSTLETLA